MDYKTLIFCLLFLLSEGLVFASTEIYEYQEVDELIEINNDSVEGKLLQDWSRCKIMLLNYRNDFKLTNNNRLIFRANLENSETYLHKQESEPFRIFNTTFQTNKWKLGFGSYRPVFGLGTIYKKSANKEYLNKITSKSSTDLQGVFGTYNFCSVKINIFLSRNDLNIAQDTDGKRKVVYYDSEKSCLEQSGFITSYFTEKLEFSLLSGFFKNDEELEQFNYKKGSYLFSVYTKYQYDSLKLEYESDYQFTKLNHIGQLSFYQDDFSTTCFYQKISEHSLNWFNLGISNKYNRNTDIYSGKCSFPLYKFAFSLGSELKNNWEINQWKSTSYLKMAIYSKYSYRVIQEVYNDYQVTKHTKYTHHIIAELFSFETSSITCSYSVNNKIDSGVASNYQLDYKADTSFGKFRLNMKVVDNFKGEEVLQDNSDNIIATFYDLDEDCLVMFNYQSKEYKHLKLSCSLIQSLYNNKINSAKIELSFLL